MQHKRVSNPVPVLRRDGGGGDPVVSKRVTAAKPQHSFLCSAIGWATHATQGPTSPFHLLDWDAKNHLPNDHGPSFDSDRGVNR